MAAESEKLFLLKVMNEQQQIADERQKFSASKRYDPKYRALTEAIRLMEEVEGVGDGDDVGDGEGDDGECVMMPPPATSPTCYPPHPKQRHLSNSLAFVAATTPSTSTTTPVVGSQTSQRYRATLGWSVESFQAH